MKDIRTQPERLQDLRMERGLSLEQLAKETNISRSALSIYETDENKEIGSTNLAILAKYYHVTTDYLLGLTNAKRPSRSFTADSRLTKEAISVLLSNKYNPLLLSEILTNEYFLRFMLDAEIYVDGNVTTQFHTFNKMMDAQRMILLKKKHPEDYNLQMETLRRISIDEDAFFEYTLSEDIFRILREIRHAHIWDIESRADTSIIDKMLSGVEDATAFSGTPRQKFKMLIQKWFGSETLKFSKNTNEQIEKLLDSDFFKPVSNPKKKKRKHQTKN